MPYPLETLTREQLAVAVAAARRFPHKKFRKGDLYLDPAVFATPGLETNIILSRFALLDCTGSIHLGPWCNIGHRCRIYTHDHLHLGRKPLARTEAEHGLLWQDKYIGADVWIHDGALVLYQVSEIPDGVVLGAGSVLTRNPGPYEIWAGVPARKIGERGPDDAEAIAARLNRPRFRLSDRGVSLPPFRPEIDSAGNPRFPR
ncbi:MAG: acyltransferase [Thermodesulfobacteriota bacterium]